MSHEQKPNVPATDGLPADRPPTLRVVPMPADTNAAGHIFGGWLMSQVDIAGSIPAMIRARGPVATVAVNNFQFHQPVLVGDLISVYAAVARVGTTSITIEVEAYGERPIRTHGWQVECVKVASATVTYVAIDAEHHKRPVPKE